MSVHYHFSNHITNSYASGCATLTQLNMQEEVPPHIRGLDEGEDQGFEPSNPDLRCSRHSSASAF